MIGIKIKGKFLDLFPGTTLTTVLNNPAFLGGEIVLIPGSFTFPINIPLNNHNKEVIGHVNRIDNTNTLLSDESCEIHFRGNLVWPGKATIQVAGPYSAKLYIIINETSKIKDMKINELELGGERDVAASPAAFETHAKDTALNPLNHDYIFFPVKNNAFWDISEDDPGTYESSIQNFYHPPDGKFIQSSTQQVSMPFVRLDYLLSQIFAEANFHFVNNWQTVDELKKIVLYNNKSIYINNVWLNPLILNKHVTESEAGDFVKKIVRTFALGIFFDYFENTITLEPLKNILLENPKHNWTKHAAKEYEISTAINFPRKFCFADDEYDKLFEFYGEVEGGVKGEVEFLSELVAPTYEDGLYYVTSRNTFYYFNPSGSPVRDHFFHTKKLLCHDTGIGEDEFISEIPSLYNSLASFVDYNGYMETWLLPDIKNYGSHDDFGMKTDFSDRLIAYRGMYNDNGGNAYPLGSNNVYDFAENKIADYALLWNTQYGIFETWWKEWYNFLQNKKDVKRDLLLDIRDILNFKFQDKVRIGNMNYFVKSLKVTLSSSGIMPTEAHLVTTL